MRNNQSMALIDCHLHVWNTTVVDLPWLADVPQLGPQYDLHDDDAAQGTKATGVTAVVLVQAENSVADTDYMVARQAEPGLARAVVGWIDLTRPDLVSQQLARWPTAPLVGIRHLIHDEPNPDWVIQPQVLRSLKLLGALNLSFDVLAERPELLDHLPLLAESAPGTILVLDHLGKPPLEKRRRNGAQDPAWQRWQAGLSAAAQYPNVFAKVSGINTTVGPSWSPADLQPALDWALEQFGSERLLLGSDWPVATLASPNYEHAFGPLATWARSLGGSATENLNWRTATRAYPRLADYLDLPTSPTRK